MRRRDVLATLATAGLAGTAGCGMIRSRTTLSDPTIHTESPGRRSLRFTSNGQEVGSLGVTGYVASDAVTLQTELWHRDGTSVESITLGVWMPPTGTGAAADVGVLSPVEGDSSPPPSVTLSSPRRTPGTVIEIDDLDDLADETISTLDLVVRPGSETATTVVIDSTIELSTGDWLTGGYTLDGRLELEFPELRQN